MSARVLSFSEMEIVGNSITETDVAMELCKKVQVEEECVIDVEESTNLYTHLRFSVLAGTGIPRPLGMCLWSALHVLLVIYEAFKLLVLFAIVFVPAVLIDALILIILIQGVLVTLILAIIALLAAVLVMCIGYVLVLLWLVITCQCYITPPQSQDPKPAPVVEGGAAAAGVPWGSLKRGYRFSLTLKFFNHVILVSFPNRRKILGELCREIVPWYNTIVI